MTNTGINFKLRLFFEQISSRCWPMKARYRFFPSQRKYNQNNENSGCDKAVVVESIYKKKYIYICILYRINDKIYLYYKENYAEKINQFRFRQTDARLERFRANNGN